LRSHQAQTPAAIVHLATHGEFRPGQPSNSFIQFWDQAVTLDQLDTLGLNQPEVELLVLSACRTALGDVDAELGFSGLAVATGVRSALGSLWYVSDVGTLALMSSFYQALKTAPIKAEALRQTQLAFLRGDVAVESNRIVTPWGTVDLPDVPQLLRSQTLSHPYYWSAFTLIGSPW
jgi:CHAT domain-containing protein